MVAAGIILAAGSAHAQTQGVGKSEIVLGSIQDLSGPIAAFGKQLRFGMNLRVTEVNEQGGVHGRKIRLVVEDAAYDPKKAVLVGQKLINQDKVFAMMGNIGTAPNMAVMPIQFEKGVVNFMPVTAAREMYEPFHRLKFSFAAPYYDQIRIALPKLVKEKSAKKVCTIYQDDDFGVEVLRGAEDGLKTIGMTLAEKTSYKRGATDFSSQVARLKAGECDLVVLGTIIRETIGTIGQARKTGFSPTFLGSSAAYTDLIHKLGGKAMDGLYATMTVANPYTDSADKKVSFWANKYKTAFNEEPTVFSAYGYTIMDMFVRAAEKAGPTLTTDAFVKVMETTPFDDALFGGPTQVFGPKKRLGNELSRLSKLEDGRWKVISDYVKP
ncbi:MAG: ABC transporter substrate-binding protein [Lautropia sp.]